MESLIQDIRYAARMLWKAPAFTLVAVIALALGIGANTVIFSVVNAVMLRPLPYPQSDRLMMLFHSYPKINLPRATVSPIGFLYYRDHAQSFESIRPLSFYRGPQNLTGSGDPERVKSVLTTAGVFLTVAVHAMLGRVFRP